LRTAEAPQISKDHLGGTVRLVVGIEKEEAVIAAPVENAFQQSRHG
jgi:hypothetical protein